MVGRHRAAMRAVAVVAAAGLLLAAVACKDIEQKDVEPQEEVEQKDVEWKPFTPRDGGWTATFPGTPERKTEKEADGSVTVDHGVTLAGTDAYFIVMTTDFPETMEFPGAEKIFSAVVAAFEDGVESRKYMTVEGHEGLELEILMVEDGVEVAVTNRLFMVGRRLYQIMAGIRAAEPMPVETQRFIDSFKLLRPPAPGAPAPRE